MKQLVQNLRNGELKLEEVPYPSCGRGGVVVRTVRSVISAGTERSIIDLAKKSLLGKARARPDLVKRAWEKARKEGLKKVLDESLNRLDEPFPLGYSASGVIVEVGQAVTEFAVGDRVAIAGSGYANHAEYNFVPVNLCLRVPNNGGGMSLSFEEAAFCMLGGIALQGIREARLTFGERVAVVGLGLLGQLALQILEAVGCEAVGIDIDPKKCQLARELGASRVYDNPGDAALAYEDSMDAVLICAASQSTAPLDLAQKLAVQKGTIVLVGVCDIQIERKYFWDKELEFRVSKAAGPGILDENYENLGIDYPIGYIRWPERRNMGYFLNLVAVGKVKLKPLVTHRFPIAEAVSAYTVIMEGKEPYVSVLLEYPEPASEHQDLSVLRTVPQQPLAATAGGNEKRSCVGVIGAGAFARNVFLPVLKRFGGVQLAAVATSRGITSNHIASKYGFGYATSDYRRVLDDPAIGSVFIMTRHNLHASMVVEALRAGKHVFVEKPLCVRPEELPSIVEAYEHGNSTLMVGFNRRYSTHAREIREFFGGDRGSYVINCRVNAGYIPSNHWTQDPEVGGGRVIGEVCHFIDFLGCVTESTPVRVYAAAIQATGRFAAEDNVVATIQMADGSVGTVTYTSQGDKSYPREVFEIFHQGMVYYLEDFRYAIQIKGGKRRRLKCRSQEVGYEEEIRCFLEGRHGPADTRRCIVMTRAVFALTESLRTGEPFVLSESS
ncbi:MAG: Gfo/Idh/MocA family oxidoreductase [Planctomycetes bacterium]|nr:Gfo/Idh/MocA family oxidoreductase [Planctomycetota bacterium]